MPDDFENVIKFDKRKHSIQKDSKGVFYVRLEKDENGNFYNANHLIDYCNNSIYLVRVMKIENKKPCMYNYKVSGNELASFVSGYSDNNNEEKIIEISKCQSNSLA